MSSKQQHTSPANPQEKPAARNGAEPHTAPQAEHRSERAQDQPAPERQTRGESKRSVAVAVVLGLARLVLVVGLLGAGAYAAYWFNVSEGAAARSESAGEEASRLVETVPATRADTPVAIRALGAVMPAREAVLRPRVSGMITDQHSSFEPGGFFEAGQFMVQIDRADYEQTIRQRESDLARARATLQIEKGDQAVAREELELLEVDIPEINRELILRMPQVNQAQAEVDSATAALERAQLDLDRTRIAAPFDGHVVSRAVAVGNNISAGDELATFIGADRYWVEVAVPVASLRWIKAPVTTDEPGPHARVRYPRAWGPDASREGRVSQLVGRLEEGSNLARVIVSIPDPLARLPENEGQPELILDAYVNVEIIGATLEDCFLVSRDHVREGDVVWVMNDENRLEIKEVEIAYRGREHAYVTSGLDDGDRVITTNLQTPVRGMLLRESTGDENGRAQS